MNVYMADGWLIRDFLSWRLFFRPFIFIFFQVFLLEVDARMKKMIF